MAVAPLETWRCVRCGTDNVADRDHCSSRDCHAQRVGRTTAAHILPMDLEEFCRRQFAKNGRRMLAGLEMAAGEIYLTLTPPNADPPQAFLITNENGVAPCDNFGRVSW